MTVRSSTRGLPGLPRGRCGLSAFQASSDSQNKLFAMTIALQRLKSSANISSKSTSCMGSLPKPYSQQFGRLCVRVPVAGHGPCPWVGRDKSRLADFDGGVKVFPDPSTWALMLLGFAGLGYAGYRRARRASVVGRRRLT